MTTILLYMHPQPFAQFITPRAQKRLESMYYGFDKHIMLPRPQGLQVRDQALLPCPRALRLMCVTLSARALRP